MPRKAKPDTYGQMLTKGYTTAPERPKQSTAQRQHTTAVNKELKKRQAAFEQMAAGRRRFDDGSH